MMFGCTKVTITYIFSERYRVAGKRSMRPAERLFNHLISIIPLSIRILGARILTRIVDDLVGNSCLHPKELRGQASVDRSRGE